VNRYEELLVKASACLSEVSKIEDPSMRAKVLELVYQSQLVARAAILQEIDAAWSIRDATKHGIYDSR
jgi:hypothetical protein